MAHPTGIGRASTRTLPSVLTRLALAVSVSMGSSCAVWSRGHTGPVPAGRQSVLLAQGGPQHAVAPVAAPLPTSFPADSGPSVPSARRATSGIELRRWAALSLTSSYAATRVSRRVATVADGAPALQGDGALLWARAAGR